MSTAAGSRLLEAAIDYAARGWRVVPLIEREKRPRLKAWQREATTDEATICRWWEAWPAANVGVLMGPTSNLIDLECDSPEAEQDLLRTFGDSAPVTPTFQGSRGKHRLFRWRAGLPAVACCHFGKVECRLGNGDRGAQSVFPPSIHPTGEVYKWLIGPDDVDVAELPDAVAAMMFNMAGEPTLAPPVTASGKTSEDWAAIAAGVGEGGRNQAAAQLIGLTLHNMADPGDNAAVANAWALVEAWNERNSPPLPVKELRATFDSILRNERAKRRRAVELPPAQNGKPDFPLTDAGNGERFAARYGEQVRYIHPWEKWLNFDGRRWRLDDTGAVDQLAKQTARAMWREGASEQDPARRDAKLKWAKQTESASRLSAMLRLARSEHPVPVLPKELDIDPWLLNCRNGTLDLRTGELRPHRREDMLTKLCPVEYLPDANCPEWIEFLSKIFGRRWDLIDFLQRLCGYFLTGSVDEQILPIFYGDGANGKSTLINALLEMLGEDYAMKGAHDLLMLKNSAHPTERADLHGKRLAACVETDDGARLAESLVKDLTGGDRVRVRRMREDFWEFTPTHKIVLATNHRPEIRGTDHAMWRRLRLVPFDVVIPRAEQDKRLAAKLRKEQAGLLAWCVRGCMDWQKDGLTEPADVLKATESYRADQDVFGRFLEEHCTVGEGRRVRASVLFDHFRQWSGDRSQTQKQFSSAMQARGFKRVKASCVWYEGVEL